MGVKKLFIEKERLISEFFKKYYNPYEKVSLRYSGPTDIQDMSAQLDSFIKRKPRSFEEREIYFLDGVSILSNAYYFNLKGKSQAAGTNRIKQVAGELKNKDYISAEEKKFLIFCHPLRNYLAHSGGKHNVEIDELVSDAMENWSLLRYTAEYYRDALIEQQGAATSLFLVK